MSYLSGLKGISDRVNKLDAENNFNLVEIDIEKLVPSKNNFYGIRDIEEMVESIKEHGLMHNLVVRKLDDGNYEILSGERRYTALKKLGCKKVPCKVKELDELDGEILLIQANSRQRELSHIEKMKGIERLKELYKLKKANGEEIPKGKTRDIIGNDIGLSGVQVGRYMKVSEKLIDPLKDKLEDGTITLTQADTLSNLYKEEQEELLEKIEDSSKKITNAEIDILVQGIKQPVEDKRDVELLNEVNFDKTEQHKPKIDTKKIRELLEDKSTNRLSEILKLLEENKTPKIVISDGCVEAILFSQRVTYEDGAFNITLSGFSTSNRIKINSDTVEEIEEININNGNMTPKKAYKIAEGWHLWFGR